MGKSGVQKLARVLKALVTITFICNLLVLPLVPGVVSYSMNGGMTAFAEFWAYDPDDALWNFIRRIWTVWGVEHAAVLTLFLLFCGCCTAVLLWQGRRVLNTILRADTFTMENAANMRRAAVCSFLISFAALARTVWGFWYYQSLDPLFTYNALFCPIALMGGLLCLVMSALFRQAAELKAENDLTI